MNDLSYVLVTAAHNEERFVRATLESVLSQSLRPRKWVIVSDGSTDRTADIVSGYAVNYPIIQLLRSERKQGRSFKAQAVAIRAGYLELQQLDYGFIGNLDADITLEPDYFIRLLKHFAIEPRLGLAGGFITEEDNGVFRNRRYNSVRSVAHAVQLFRRECFEDIGGYAPLEHGGPDWHAEVLARMKGWEVRCFPDLPVRHHRRTGSAESLLRDRIGRGKTDYSLGSHPVFEMLKCLRRIPQTPRFWGALATFCAFAWCYIARKERQVSPDFLHFLRQEQMSRVRAAFAEGVSRLTKIGFKQQEEFREQKEKSAQESE